MTAAIAELRPSGGERAALRVLQFGGIAVVLAVSTFHAFELDRFFIPKELALHLTALLAGLFAFRAVKRLTVTGVDVLMIAYLVLSVASSAMATNRWLSIRAVAISASAYVVFLVSRALRLGGLSRPLLGALAAAVVFAAVTSLLQTYGLDIDLFSENRAPGGTLGNRNFVAHVAAFGFPILLWAALTARRRRSYAAAGIAIVSASLVLTRSRAAWLAFAASAVIFAGAMLISAAARHDARTWKRGLLITILAVAGVALAIVIPNALHWRSHNPYLESAQRVADFQEGSGRGRLVQYEHSLAMAARHPLFGVGPGNWPVEYARYATRNDPSLSESEPGMTVNPWPSSDWIAAISERGFVTAIVLALVFVMIAASAFKRLHRAVDADDALGAAALMATIAAALIAGMFDAVLLLAVPAFLVWAAIGAFWVREGTAGSSSRPYLAAALVLSAVGGIRSASQLISIGIYSNRSDRASLSRAALVDPGNYRVHLRLERSGRRDERCVHARAAHALYPAAVEAAAVSRSCGE